MVQNLGQRKGGIKQIGGGSSAMERMKSLQGQAGSLQPDMVGNTTTTAGGGGGLEFNKDMGKRSVTGIFDVVKDEAKNMSTKDMAAQHAIGMMAPGYNESKVADYVLYGKQSTDKGGFAVTEKRMNPIHDLYRQKRRAGKTTGGMVGNLASGAASGASTTKSWQGGLVGGLLSGSNYVRSD